MPRKATKTVPVASADAVAHESVLVASPPKRSAIERKSDEHEALSGIKNKIFGDAMKVVNNFMRAGQIDPEVDADRDPAYYEMMTELGDEEEVKRAYRVARTGWLPSSETPGFVKVAANMAIGIMKANAAEKGGAKVLNIQRVVFDSSLIPTFDERDVE